MRELQHYRYEDIISQIHHLPISRFILAIFITFINYSVLTLYDTLGFRYIGVTMPFRNIYPASFTAYSLGHNIGLSILSGGAVRYRFYSAWGVTAGKITQLISFCGVTYWIGFLALGGTALLTTPASRFAGLHLSSVIIRFLGFCFLATLIFYFTLTAIRKKTIRIRQWEFALPSTQTAGLQLLLSVCDWLLASSILYILLPVSQEVSFPLFVSFFLLSAIIGAISNIPGGLGVFETVLLILLKNDIDPSILIGRLLVFRFIYYLLPLLVSSLFFILYETYNRQKMWKPHLTRLRSIISHVMPIYLSVMVFMAGAILLFSGVTPTLHGRLAFLSRLIPLFGIEMSHLFSSLVGLGLLLLARGIHQRLDAAYYLSMILLAMGIVFSLTKGFDYEEALILSVFLLLLAPSRRHFYRKASLIADYFTPGWIVMIGLVLICAGGLGYFSYKHVEYTNELWWEFTVRGDASRFLRAGVALAVMLITIASHRMLRPVSPASTIPPSDEDMRFAETLVQNSSSTMAHLALLGDKAFLFDKAHTAMIMYAIHGKNWVALGDPLGKADAVTDLLWQYKEMCHHAGSWPVFYQIKPGMIPEYLDLGLSLLKLGEEGRVPLESFNLKGGSFKNQRRIIHHLEQDGCIFKIIPTNQIQGIIPNLKTISDDWLSSKNTHEKRFSLGFFNESYLSKQPIAIIEKNDRITAFANILQSADKHELSIDLMRYSQNAPDSVMEYLFLKLMLWGKDAGYTWFNLGMAPLSGLQEHTLAPVWHRFGSFLYLHGEHFYNFQGLRQYKEKFKPIWEPRYLASRSGFALPRILTDIASLISGGIRGAVMRDGKN